jgi:hypothetical protein
MLTTAPRFDSNLLVQGLSKPFEEHRGNGVVRCYGIGQSDLVRALSLLRLNQEASNAHGIPNESGLSTVLYCRKVGKVVHNDGVVSARLATDHNPNHPGAGFQEHECA